MRLYDHTLLYAIIIQYKLYEVILPYLVFAVIVHYMLYEVMLPYIITTAGGPRPACTPEEEQQSPKP